MIAKIATQVTWMTRRNLLSQGMVCALACLVPGRMLTAMAKPRAGGGVDGFQCGTNLYAFPSPRTKKTTVIALTWPIVPHEGITGWQPVSEVRIHSGWQRWDVRGLENYEDAMTPEEKGCRTFAGSILSGQNPKGAILKAVVVEAPTEIFARDGAAGIWAERFTKAGGRDRIGSPFLAKILAGNRVLPDLYHRTSPEGDRGRLMQQVAAAISTKAPLKGNVGDPEAYGRRLADQLLPDVLHYDPNRPLGFTFADQNGRHPQEAAAQVVNSILTGDVLSARGCPSVRLQEEFPYFLQPS
jgi:hypothetical protein